MKALILSLFLFPTAAFANCYLLEGAKGKFDLCLSGPEASPLITIKVSNARCLPNSYKSQSLVVSPASGSIKAYVVTQVLHKDCAAELDIVPKSEIHFIGKDGQVESVQITAPAGTDVFAATAR